MTEAVATLRQWVEESHAIVFFGGAGVSTESGIPDFRSTDGLYHQQYAYPPETILSHSFYRQNPREFYRFYRNKMLYLGAQPNAAHKKLAEWEAQGKLLAVITQNIDGLHQLAGSRNVLELHGSVLRNHCERCGAAYGVAAVVKNEDVPRCSCGGVIKPDVVLYEEGLDEDVLTRSVSAIRQADIPLSSPWNFEMQGMTHGSFSDHGTGSFCFDDVVKINAEYVQKGLQDCNEVWYNKETSPCDAPCDTVREHRP